MKYLLPILFLLVACSPSARIARICKKHPATCERKTDTVTVLNTQTITIPRIMRDTQVVTNVIDTVTIETERFKTRVIRIHDTLQITTDVFADTITVTDTLRIPVDGGIEVKRRSFWDVDPSDTFLTYWNLLWLIPIILLIMLIIRMLRR